ncbi:MAG: hypothetical protein WBB82_12775 [Limnothrix sp.]
MNKLFDKLLDTVGNWNPQLFRELKGRFTRRNVAIAVGASLLTQILLIFSYLGGLPEPRQDKYDRFSRYCTGTPDDYMHSSRQCFVDALGIDWQINWQLWHLDLFVGLSIISVGLLLIISSHLINADLTKEEKRGTLGFVRLSPQSAQRIILGKILGVPSLIYLGVGLALPLHFFLGLQANISPAWIAMFDLVAIAASATCFSVAVLWSFIGRDFFAGFQPWIYSGGLGFYLAMMTVLGLENDFPADNSFDWLRMIYPGNIFYYIMSRSSLPTETINYFEPSNWFGTQFYHSTHWGLRGLISIFGHYALITFVAWLGIGRRFYDPQKTVISKKTAYGITIFSTIFMTGFACSTDEAYRISDNFGVLQVFYFALIISLTLLLTPTRQQVQDWSRFRHQGKFARQLWADLLWGDRSPALGAIAVMIISSTGIMAIVAATNPFLEDKSTILVSLVLQAGTLFMLAALIQFIFLNKKQRGVWLVVTLSSLTIVPFILAAMFSDRFVGAIALGLFSAFPTIVVDRAFSELIFFAIAGQWLGIVGSVIVLRKRIRRLGDSEVKTLLQSPAESPENMLT